MSLTASQLDDSSTGKYEELHQKGGLVVSAVSGCYADSDNKTDNRWNMNGSKMESPVNRTDNVKIRKVAEVTSASNSPCQRSKNISDATAANEVKDIVVIMAKKNTRKRKHEVEKTAVILIDDIARHKNVHGTAPTKNDAVNGFKRSCTNSPRPGKTARQVSDVQCKRTKFFHQDMSVNSTSARTMKPSTKNGFLARGDAAGKRAGSVMNSLNCTEVKSHVTSAAQKNTKECSNIMTSTNSNVTVPPCRRSRRQAADALYKQDDDVQYSGEVKNDAQTVHETVTTHKTPSLHRRREKGVSGGSRVSEQARAVVHCRKEKNEIVQAATNTKRNDRKWKVDKTGRIPSNDITHQHNMLSTVPTTKCTRYLLRTEKVVSDVQHKKTKREDESTSLNSVTVKPSGKEMGFLAGGNVTGKQAGNIVREEKKGRRSHVIGAAKKTAKEHSNASSCTNFTATRSQLPAADALYEQDDKVNSSEDRNDVTKTVCDTDTKHDISLSCSGFGMTLISSRRRRALVEDSKECELAGDVHCSEGKNDAAEAVNVNTTNNNTRTNKNNKKKKNDEAKETSSFHMTLRTHTRQQYSLMAGKRSPCHRFPSA